MWIALDDEGICAVGGSTFIQYPRLKAFAVRFGAGRNPRAFQLYMDEMCAWGKSQGAALVESNISRGWHRFMPLTGWLHSHNCVERML